MIDYWKKPCISKLLTVITSFIFTILYLRIYSKKKEICSGFINSSYTYMICRYWDPSKITPLMKSLFRMKHSVRLNCLRYLLAHLHVTLLKMEQNNNFDLFVIATWRLHTVSFSNCEIDQHLWNKSAAPNWKATTIYMTEIWFVAQFEQAKLQNQEFEVPQYIWFL